MREFVKMSFFTIMLTISSTRELSLNVSNVMSGLIRVYFQLIC